MGVIEASGGNRTRHYGGVRQTLAKAVGMGPRGLEEAEAFETTLATSAINSGEQCSGVALL